MTLGQQTELPVTREKKKFLLLNPPELECNTNKKEGDQSNAGFIFLPTPCGPFYSQRPRIRTKYPPRVKEPMSLLQLEKQVAPLDLVYSDEAVQCTLSIYRFGPDAANTISYLSCVWVTFWVQFFLLSFFKYVSTVLLRASCYHPYHHHHACSVQLTCQQSIVAEPWRRCSHMTQRYKLP